MKVAGQWLTSRALMVALALVTSCAIPAMNVASASAQQNANIYAVADLIPTGAGTEGSASTATFERTQNGSTQVTLVIMNSRAGASYQAEIRDGSCGGAVLYSLTAVQTDPIGAGNATTVIPAEVEFGRWYVEVHSGDAVSGSSLSLCGQVNPALAGGPPVVAPGMPSTGGATGSGIYWLGLLGIALALLGYIVNRMAPRLARHY